MISTVTLNPMLDKTVHVETLQRGKVHRSSRVDVVVGGKGVNVSRQLQHLHCATHATGFLGGPVGGMVEGLLDQEGLPHRFVRVKGMTREGVTYLEPDGTWTAVFEPPHKVTASECSELIELCRSLERKSTWFVCSGSSPDPVADGVFAAIVSNARTSGIKTVLDSYGRAFSVALDAIPTVVKVNREEFEQSFGKALSTEREVCEALEGLLARGISYAVLTDGARPLYAAHGKELWKATPPEMHPVNTTGSGDSMTAGLLYGLLQRWEFDRVLRFGTAAGASNARMWQVAASSMDEIIQMEREVNVSRIRG